MSIDRILHELTGSKNINHQNSILGRKRIEAKQALYKDIDDRILALQQNGLVSQAELRTKLKEYYGVNDD